MDQLRLYVFEAFVIGAEVERCGRTCFVAWTSAVIQPLSVIPSEARNLSLISIFRRTEERFLTPLRSVRNDRRWRVVSVGRRDRAGRARPSFSCAVQVHSSFFNATGEEFVAAGLPRRAAA